MIRVLLALLLWIGSAQAASLEGMTFPDTYPVGGQNLVLNGLGLRTFTILNVRVYAAGLYLAQRSHDPQQILNSPTPKVLLLQFLRSGSKEQIARQFRAGEEVNCGDGSCDPADQSDFDRLVASAPAAKAGDTFTFVITKDGVRFYADDRLEILAPFGLEDLFALRLRPNPLRPTDGFARTAGSAVARWPELRIEAP